MVVHLFCAGQQKSFVPNGARFSGMHATSGMRVPLLLEMSSCTLEMSCCRSSASRGNGREVTLFRQTTSATRPSPPYDMCNTCFVQYTSKSQHTL